MIAGDRFQYVNVLNYLRSRFPFIDTTTVVANKQLSAFMFKIPDDVFRQEVIVAMLYFWIERQA